MRSSTTTRELSALLARPAFRALESVAKQLGVRLPAPSRQESSEASEQPAPEQAVSGPGEATASPLLPADLTRSPAPVPGAAPRPSSEATASRAETRGASPRMARGEALHANPVAGEKTSSVSSPTPPAARAEVHGGVPTALEQPGSPGRAPSSPSGARPRDRHLVRLISQLEPRSTAPTLSRAPFQSLPADAERAETRSAGPRPFAASDTRSVDGSSSGPAERAPVQSDAPVATLAETPHTGSLVEATRARLAATPAPPLQASRGEASPTPEPPPPANPSGAIAPGGARAADRRRVRLLPRPEQATVTSPVEARAERSTPPSSQGDAPRPERRLTFLPAPEPTAPPALVRPPSPVAPGLAEQVTSGMAPVLERAHQLTRAAVPPERAMGAQGAATPPGEAVRNTFNVNVHLEPSGAAPGVDRRALEEALVEILRDTARRHGLEV
jgi:hypothetical protein